MRVSLGNLLALLLLLASGYALFAIKYNVVAITKELASTKEQIASEQELITVLRAEWAYLNHPDRLNKLASKHLPLQQVSNDQLENLASAKEDKWR